MIYLSFHGTKKWFYFIQKPWKLLKRILELFDFLHHIFFVVPLVPGAFDPPGKSYKTNFLTAKLLSFLKTKTKWNKTFKRLEWSHKMENRFQCTGNGIIKDDKRDVLGDVVCWCFLQSGKKKISNYQSIKLQVVSQVHQIFRSRKMYFNPPTPQLAKKLIVKLRTKNIENFKARE